MSEKTEADEFENDEEDGEDETADSVERLDLEDLIEDLEPPKRGAVKVDEPAWRKLERYLEEKRTAELLSDFDDYEIFEDGSGPGTARGRRRIG